MKVKWMALVRVTLKKLEVFVIYSDIHIFSSLDDAFENENMEKTTSESDDGDV